MRTVIGLIAAFFLGTGIAQAQTAAELLAKIDEKAGENAQFRDLLSHPDPERSREAMRLMAESGNPDLMRMALNAGLASADPVAQRITLQGFFASGPTLQVTFDGSSLESTKNFTSDIGRIKGTVTGNGIGFFTGKLGKYDEQQSCWLWMSSNQCGVRLSDAGAALNLYGKWASVQINESRALTGEHSLYNTGVPVPFSIPVAP